MARTFLGSYGLDAVYGIDFETYYDTEYSLRRLPTTSYITDDRFKTQMVAVQESRDRRARVMSPDMFATWAKTVNWKRCGMLGHHTHFDGLILSHHYGVVPAFYFDTLSMARPVMPIHVRLRLGDLALAFGAEEGKVDADALKEAKGVLDIPPPLYKRLAKYAGNDIEKTWFLFDKLIQYIPEDEMKVIDLTIRMYTEPTVEIDHDLVQKVFDGQVKQKQAYLDAIQATPTQLRSRETFAAMLQKLGVDPPKKISKAKGSPGKITYAFSKNDVAFKQLLKHEDPRVQDLVKAKLGITSSIVESRSARILERRNLARQPIYLSYWGARATGRWSGGDLINYQNLPKRDAFRAKVELRKALRAPAGFKFIIADQRQVECRLASWQAGNEKVLRIFRSGGDVYRAAGGVIYRKLPEELTDEERFVGKTTTLGCIYGIGAARYADTLRVGTMGPPVDITDAEARRIVAAWRQDNKAICDYWRTVEFRARTAWIAGTVVESGPVVFEGKNGNGFIHLPNGTSLRYDDVRVDEAGGLSYLGDVTPGGVQIRTHLWGGHILENITQALARALLARQLLIIRDKMKAIRIATSTHDEVLAVVPDRYAERGLEIIMKSMRDVPAWAKGVPLDVEAHLSQIYDKE